MNIKANRIIHYVHGELKDNGLDYRLLACRVNGAFQLWICAGDDNALVVMKDGLTPRRMKFEVSVELFAMRHGLNIQKLTFQESRP